ncbi:MAG: SAM-dependent methyltransferase, partial [Candidatus Methylomirabilales bacterium]
MTGSSELAGLELLELLRERIRAGGPITFADFMQITLYHPTHGYYAGRVPSPESDFRTSPSLSPWFGRLIARVLEAMWRQLDTPGRLVVIEVGAGGADLAAAAIGAVAPEVGASMTWRFVEGSPQVAKRQRDRLGDCPIPLEWAGTLGQGPGVAGCVIANEVLDNFPIHLLEVAGGEPREVYVGIAGDRLVELLGPLSLPELAPCAAGPLAALDD